MKRLSFKPELARAIRAGTKTVTRRLMNPQPDSGRVLVPCAGDPHCYRFESYHSPIWKPAYRPGEIVGIAEPWCLPEMVDQVSGKRFAEVSLTLREDRRAKPHYLADGPKPEGYGRFRQTRFLPDAFVRTRIRIVAVEAQRLQQITKADVIAEGVRIPVHEGKLIFCLTSSPNPSNYWPGTWPEIKDRPDLDWQLLRGEWCALWDSLHASPAAVKGADRKSISHFVSYPWAEGNTKRKHRGKPWHVIGNPWVWVYRFEGVSAPATRPEVRQGRSPASITYRTTAAENGGVEPTGGATRI